MKSPIRQSSGKAESKRRCVREECRKRHTKAQLRKASKGRNPPSESKEVQKLKSEVSRKREAKQTL